MSSVNTTVQSGRATRDPEMKTFGEDGKVVSFGIAVDRSVKRDGEWVQVPNFFDVSVFGNYAELIDKKLRKGDLITVQGELRYDSWENEAGEKRSKVFIVAETIDGQFAYRKADGTDTPARAEGDAPAAAPAAAAPAASGPTDEVPF